MSIEIINTTINATKTIKERTWRATQFTELGDENDGAQGAAKYRNKIFRERVTEIEGLPPSTSREAIPASAGTIVDGTDGTDPAHYPDAHGGFEPEVQVDMVNVLAYPDEETVTFGGYTVPANVMPHLMREVYDLVCEKLKEERKQLAINKAVASALQE